MDKAKITQRNGPIVAIVLMIAIVIVILVVKGCPQAEVKRNPLKVSATAGMASAAAAGPAYLGGPNSNPLTVTEGTTPYYGIIPPNETIPTTNLNVAFISTPSAILDGLVPINGSPSPGKTIGEIDVDGYNSGLSVGANGTLTNNKGQPATYNNLVLIPGTHLITMYGPFSIKSQLNVSGFLAYNVTVSNQGIASIPISNVTSMPKYDLPSNNEQWLGSTISGTYPSSFAGMSAQLTIVLPPPSGSTTPGEIQPPAQTIPSSGLVTFSNLDPTNANPVPAAGITSLKIDIHPITTLAPAKKQ